MEIFDAIARRHSYRGPFQDKPVPRDDLAKIVQAGLDAPSGCNAQTTRFVILDEPEMLGEIARIMENPPVLRTARAMIVCLAEHRPVYGQMSFGVEDAAAAVENMLLAVTALGYATVWIDGALRAKGRNQRISRLLGVPDSHETRILLPLGVPAEAGPRKSKLPFDARAAFNRFPADNN